MPRVQQHSNATGAATLKCHGCSNTQIPRSTATPNATSNTTATQISHAKSPPRVQPHHHAKAPHGVQPQPRSNATQLCSHNHVKCHGTTSNATPPPRLPQHCCLGCLYHRCLGCLYHSCLGCLYHSCLGCLSTAASAAYTTAAYTTAAYTTAAYASALLPQLLPIYQLPTPTALTLP
jgi:hypothetical protein